MSAFVTGPKGKPKRALVAAGALILFGSLMFALHLATYSSRPMAVRFAGFRDSLDGSQPQALFWITNRTDKQEWWWLHHVNLKTDGGWQQDGKTYPQLSFLEYIGPPESRYVIRLVAIPVSTTNAPIRAVFECLEKIPIRDNLIEFYLNRVKHRSVYVANGRRYFVTNEVPLNPQGRANGRQPFSSDTNPTSAAAASRRSP